jgi:hypothetical protein
MHIKCDRAGCSHEWNYTGKSRHFAVCPMCRKQVKLTLSGKDAEKKGKEISTQCTPQEEKSGDETNVHNKEK